MHSHDLTCQELVELVTDYLEGKLTPEQRAAFEAHANGCTGCTVHLEQMRLTIQLTGKLNEDHIPPSARNDLLRAFRQWKRTE
jgi:hypothetical protein